MVNIPNGAYSAKQAEEEAKPMKVEVVAGAAGCSEGSSDHLSCAEAAVDPTQAGREADEVKCRDIRRQYRQLINSIQRNRDDIVNTANDSLSEALREANALFDEVSRTREAALDAQLLVLVSDLGREKAKQLSSDVRSFNEVAFCDKLRAFAGRHSMDVNARSEPGGRDARRALSFWEAVGKQAAGWALRTDTVHFLFGSFTAEPCVRRRRQKARRTEGDGDMPVKLRKVDRSHHLEATEKEVERVLGLLQMYFRDYPETPVSYFEFVIDPHSFSRTVENIFYVSFIVRDGFARIRLDQDRLPILEPISISQVGAGDDPSACGRKQGIIALSLQDWRNIVATFEISEAMITN